MDVSDTVDRSQKKKPRYPCTSCGKLIVSLKDARKHPALGTLMCITCHETYVLVGDLSKYRGGVDLNGQDNYCRWCLDGGQLLLCNDECCKNGFCFSCIERNFGNKSLSSITNSKAWHCFICDYTQLASLRQKAAEFLRPPDIVVSRPVSVVKERTPVKIKPISSTTEVRRTKPRVDAPNFCIFSSSKLFAKPVEIKESPAQISSEPTREESPTRPPLAETTVNNIPSSTTVQDPAPVCPAKEATAELPANLEDELYISDDSSDGQELASGTTMDLEEQSDDRAANAKLKKDKIVSEASSKLDHSTTNNYNNLKSTTVNEDSRNIDDEIIARLDEDKINESLGVSLGESKSGGNASVNKNDSSNIDGQARSSLVERVNRNGGTPLDWAMRDASILNKRLKIHIDALTSSFATYSEEEFTADPKNLISWIKNVENYLTSAPHIADRCKHIHKILESSEF